jgi:hypothetical protein
LLHHRDNNQKHNNNNANNNVLFANGVNDYKCGGETALDLYLAHPAVQTAMHIPDGTA